MPFTSLCGLVRSCQILSDLVRLLASIWICRRRLRPLSSSANPRSFQFGWSSGGDCMARIDAYCMDMLPSTCQPCTELMTDWKKSHALWISGNICIPKQFWPVEGSSFTTSSCECRTLPSLHKFTFLVRHLYSLNTWAKHDFTVTKESEKTVAELGAKQLIVEVRR